MITSFANGAISGALSLVLLAAFLIVDKLAEADGMLMAFLTWLMISALIDVVLERRND